MSRSTQTICNIVLAVCVVFFAACGPSTDEPATPADEAAAADRVLLRVMSFNIEWGGTHVRFASLADAIRAADADVVGIQEAEGNLERLANDLGWYYNPRNYIISRFPLVDPAAGSGRYLFVEVSPGKVVAVANIHLPSSPSGADWLREGRTPADVEAMERDVRLTAIQPLLDVLPTLERAGFPVFLTGDFNAPSHADWTKAAVGRFPHRDIAFDWPVSRAVADAGLRDSFRTVHPDPVAQPGFTWWAGRPRIEDYNPSDPTLKTRIDYVWYAGPAEAEESLVVGEEDAEGIDIGVSPWPSDHRAVLSVFQAEPAPMPELVTTGQRVYDAGEGVQFIYRSATSSQPKLLLERVTAPGGMTPRMRLAAPTAAGTVKLPDAQLPAGHYEVSLLDDAGFTKSSNEFWILDEDAVPAIEVSGKRFATGDALPVEWSGAPGNRHDWIGIFPAASNEDTHEYLTYGYVAARSSGSMRLGPDSVEEAWPLPPGEYVARLLLDDGFQVLAESLPFSVTAREAHEEADDSH